MMIRSRNLRLLIIVLGVAIVLCSLAALVYAIWPTGALVEQSPLMPTLFISP